MLLHECLKTDEQVDPDRCEAGARLKPLVPRSSHVFNGFGEPKQVIFPATDGLQIHGQLFLPPNAKPTDKLPTIVFFHGGSRRQMLLGCNPMQYYAQAYEFNQLLANHGYAVLSVNYRSGTGYGMEFRQAKDYGVFGASRSMLDVEGCGEVYLQVAARTSIPSGLARGAVAMVATLRRWRLRVTQPTCFAAGVDLHGVHDWMPWRWSS